MFVLVPLTKISYHMGADTVTACRFLVCIVIMRLPLSSASLCTASQACSGEIESKVTLNHRRWQITVTILTCFGPKIQNKSNCTVRGGNSKIVYKSNCTSNENKSIRKQIHFKSRTQMQVLENATTKWEILYIHGHTKCVPQYHEANLLWWGTPFPRTLRSRRERRSTHIKNWKPA